MNYDVIIIGAGPAGLSAGLYAARAGMKTLIIEKETAGGQMATTDSIDNYPGSIEDAKGLSLSARMREQTLSFGAEIVMDEIKSTDLEAQPKVLTGGKKEYTAHTVIFATGANPRKLGIPGEAEYTGRGVAYCATCDGPFYSGVPIYVVGGGDSAFDEGLFLAKFGSKVTIVYRGDKPRAAQALQDKVAEKENIEVVLNTDLVEISGENGVERMVMKNSKTGEETVVDIPMSEGGFGVFIFAGYLPNTALLEGKVDLERGYVVTNDDMETKIPGVYAAGDMRKKSVRQVVTAVGDGAIAAIRAGKFVEELEG